MKRLLLFCFMSPLSILTVFGQKTAQSSVFFDTDKAILRPQVQVALHHLADSVKQLPQYTLRLQGHTDADGSDRYNQNLSERRTDAVRNFLIKEGIAAEKISIAALGETQPMASNASEDGKLRNRRVDIMLESTQPTTMASNVSPFEKGKSYHIMRLYKELSLTPQTFILKSNRDTTIRGDKGTELHFPANAFAGVAEGTPVEIKLKECYDYSSILAEHLTTKSGNNLLQTGGMIYVQALADGKELKLQKPLNILFSSAESKLKGMQLFTGERKMDKNGGMNWQPFDQRRDDPFNPLDDIPKVEDTYLSYFYNAKSNETETVAPFSYILDLTDTDTLVEEFTAYMGKGNTPFLAHRPRSKSFASHSMGTFIVQKKELMSKNKLDIHRVAFNDVYTFFKVDTYEALQKQDSSIWNRSYRGEVAKIKETKRLKDSLVFANQAFMMKNNAERLRQNEKNAATQTALSNAFSTTKLGWINCDRFAAYPENQLVLVSINDPQTASFDAKLILKKDKVIINGAAAAGQKVSFGEVIKKVAAVIVAMKIENGQSYLAMHDFITSSEPIDLKFEALSPEQIKERLKKLN